MNKGSLCILALMTAIAAGGQIASAQEESTAVKLPGVSGLVSHSFVPEGFDAVTAADSQLQLYGYPMRPDQNDAKAYAKWVKAVSLPRITPEYINTGRYHRPNQVIGKSGTEENTTLKSGNWSGWSLVGGSPVFVQVEGLWVVPAVNSQSQSINGYMSEWVGIDGNCKCNDLIQDGTEQQYTGGKASYYAWIEFIPEPEIEISNFPVYPGDVIEAYSWVTVKSGMVYGNYYLANFNTKKAYSGSLKIPAKTTFSGQSAEWIVERTEVGGSFNNPLPFYAQAYMDDAFAWRNGSNKAIGFTSGTSQNIEMYQGSTALSKSTKQDSDSMWFEWLAY